MHRGQFSGFRSLSGSEVYFRDFSIKPIGQNKPIPADLEYDPFRRPTLSVHCKGDEAITAPIPGQEYELWHSGSHWGNARVDGLRHWQDYSFESKWRARLSPQGDLGWQSTKDTHRLQLTVPYRPTASLDRLLIEGKQPAADVILDGQSLQLEFTESSLIRNSSAATPNPPIGADTNNTRFLDATVSSRNGHPISAIACTSIRKAVFWGLSFFTGGMMGPLSVTGLDNNDSISFITLQEPRFDNSPRIPNWSCALSASAAATSIIRVCESFLDSDRLSWWLRPITWYCAAGDAHGAPHNALVQATIALEALAWQAGTSHRFRISTSGFEKLVLADKIRLACMPLEIDLSITSEEREIIDEYKIDAVDIVDLIVSARNDFVHSNPKRIAALPSGPATRAISEIALYLVERLALNDLGIDYESDFRRRNVVERSRRASLRRVDERG
jgi:hypothetical protein